ncbi:kyphoscoliosis peptidase-like [Saccostrea echinata]|uniref:kyphoscoliosis peptidase-like n=1 Tax=Saccostrea echinata TaxID=191078 RepID=UPI002A7EB576|nr:kyphoscoliosis peptidase-like [Saccostrea echinata]
MGRCSSKPCCEITDVTTLPETRLISVQPIVDEDLAPIPPSLRRDDVISDLSMFKKVDSYAAKAPKSTDLSVHNLAKYLSKASKTNLGRVRAFYHWICNHVELDLRSFLNNYKKPVAAEFKMHTKVALCYGYAELFAELCRLSNIPVKTLYGFVKGYGYNATKPFKYTQPTNHAWNAVHVIGQWCLVDCTLGAGHVNDDGHYTREFENYYFLTDPDQLISTHFPYMGNNKKESKAWQLLQKPLTLQTFNKNVKRTIKSFQWGVDLVSHRQAVIQVTLSSTVFIKGTTRMLNNVAARLTDTDGNVHKQYTLVQNPDQNLFSIRIRPPTVGKFRLTILGSVDKNDTTLYALVSYILRCRQTEPKVFLYPKHSGVWRSRADYRDFGFQTGVDSPLIITPKDGILELTLPIEKKFPVSFKVSYSECTLKNIERYVLVENIGSAISIRGHFPEKGFYKLQIFCKAKSGNYEPVLLYLIDCTKDAMKHTLPFPVMYSSASEYHCQLLEPLTRELPEETWIKIRFRSSDIIKAVVNGRKIEKGNGDVWRAAVRTSTAGGSVRVAGTNDPKGRYWVLYEFIIVKGANSLELEDVLTARSVTSQPPTTQRSENQSLAPKQKGILKRQIKEKTVIISK